ncbi:MAG: ankyrin repeat domain-containing protein [Campylobacterota bacterium]|nr:ankyrin repeat domain-containing protein [Campylobacterota bacterium]
MFKEVINKIRPTMGNLKKELLNQKFHSDIADIIIKSKKIDINEINEDKETLLHECLYKEKWYATEWLIKNGADTLIKNKYGLTPERLAVEKGNLDALKCMIRNSNLDVNQTDKHGRSLLQDATIMGHDHIIQYLLKHTTQLNHTDNKNRNVAFDAIANGKYRTVDNLLSNEELDLNIIDSNGNTILHDKNVLYNDKLAIKLLEHGADPAICNNDGTNFLELTALRGEEGQDVLDAAIRCGCDVNSKVANNNTILMEVMYAFARISDSEHRRRDGLKDVAKKLIHNGLNISAINNQGENVLFDIIRMGDLEGCAFLLENNVNLNLQNHNGETVLFTAIVKGVKNLDIIILLIQYGINPTLKNKYDKTVFEVLNNIILHTHDCKELEDIQLLKEISAMGNYMVVLKELLAIKNINLDILDSYGNPLTFTPFLYGDIQTTRLYFKYGLDINNININKHSLFYEYILRVFENNEYVNNFRENLIFLMANKANINIQNQDGQSIYTKIALNKECNLKLFRKLIEVTKHDYSSTDNDGRTIIHACVWSNNIDLLKLTYGTNRNIHEITDKFNILPIAYAALFGHKDIAKEFLRRNTIVRSGEKVPKNIIKKFIPLLKNVENLNEDCVDEDKIKKIKILQEEVYRSFTL